MCMSSPDRATGAHAPGRCASHSRELRPRQAHPSRYRPSPRTLLTIAACSGTGLLLAACSSSAPAKNGASAPRRVFNAGVAIPAVGTQGAGKLSLRLGGTSTTSVIKLLPQTQSLIYTANLTIRVKDPAATAAKMTSLVTGLGGYVAGQQETTLPGSHGTTQVSLTLKIPAAVYHSTLTTLATYGPHIAFNSQATDVTQQVADVNSRVASAQAAIRQLRALLAKAGSVGSLLAVQDEINSQESALESLLAQQQALAHETSYGTVSVVLLGHHARVVKKIKKTSHGFVGGLGTGWRALVAAANWVLTALGVVLPFAVIAALLAGIALGSRRRNSRRRTPPATDPPTPATP
jgi:Domain of unknown function (DUF4349)